MLAGETLLQFQILTGRGIQHDALFTLFTGQTVNMRQHAALGFLDITQQAAGGGDCQRPVIAAEAGQIVGLELFTQESIGTVGIKVPGRARFDGRNSGPVPIGSQTFIDQQFSGLQAYQFRLDSFFSLQLKHHKPAAGQIQISQTILIFLGMQRGDQVVPPLLEQCLVGQRAGCHNAHYLAFHRTLAGGRIADLFADGDGLAKAHQPREITLHCVIRHAGHRNRLSGRPAAMGQGNVQQFGGPFGVIVEQFIEVTHAVEQQDVGMFRLDLQILLHHWRVLLGFGRGRHMGNEFIEFAPLLHKFSFPGKKISDSTSLLWAGILQ